MPETRPTGKGEPGEPGEPGHAGIHGGGEGGRGGSGGRGGHADQSIMLLAYRLDRLEAEHKEFKTDIIKSFTAANDRVDKVQMVLLAGTFSIIVFFIGAAFALLTGAV